MRINRIGARSGDYQQLEALRTSRRKRRELNAVFVEGVQSINAALDAGSTFTELACDANRNLSGWAETVLRRADPPVLHQLETALMASLSERDETSELIAVVERPPDDLARIEMPGDGCVLVFDRPSSEGNLGSAIRSVDAFGASGVVTFGHGVDSWDPKTLRASVGSVFSIPVVHVEGLDHLAGWLRRLRDELPDLALLATSGRRGTALYDCDLRRPLVIIMGNETSGLSQRLIGLCDEALTIPMHGRPTSLNVASSASVILYEMSRQRHVR